MSDSNEAGLFGIGFTAALGGLSAVMVDLFQKKDASAIYQLTSFVNKTTAGFDPMGNYALPVGGVGLLLMVLSIVLAFFAGARSKRAAFYAGASVLTVMMTLVPYQQPIAPSSGSVRQLSQAAPLGPSYVPAAYFGADVKDMVKRDGRIWSVQDGGPISVVVVVHTEGGDPARISGVLYDAVSRRSYQLGYAAPQGKSGTNATYRFDFAIDPGPAKGETLADLKLRVEAPGYKTTTATQTVTQAGTVQIDVTMPSTKVPQFLQRALERPQF